MTKSNEMTSLLQKPVATDIAIARLELFGSLSDNEKDALRSACDSTRHIQAGRDVVAAGSTPNESFAVVSGWCARYRIFPDGLRRYAALYIAGDFPDLNGFLARPIENGVITISD